MLIKDRKLLVERSKDKKFFVAPGGKLEPGETASQALVRELKEEFEIEVQEADLEAWGTFSAAAANLPEKNIKMDVFMVKKWKGEPSLGERVEEIRWINSQIPKGIRVGSIFEHEVIPRLKQEGLID